MSEQRDDDMLTVPAAARRMGMSETYVRRLVAERRIAFHKMGRSVRIAPADVAAHVEQARVDPIVESDVWARLRRVG